MEEGNACPAATPHQHSTLDMISLPTFTELSTQQRSSNKHNCRDLIEKLKYNPRIASER